ncbi:MAG: alcohol dehydrogenase catalytic domain-containing protein [Tabrizicola sp.]
MKAIVIHAAKDLRIEDPGTTTFAKGQLVAVSPSRPCGTCKFCLEGLPNQCLDMRFYGSAMPFPHIQGAFREVLVAEASQCVDATGMTPGEAAMAEPLAVTLHATTRPAEIVATDLSDFTLSLAAPRPRGVILQLGLGDELTLPMMAITAKELELRGSFRFHPEFAVGVGLMQKGMIDVKPLITHAVPLAQAKDAFRLASDRSPRDEGADRLPRLTGTRPRAHPVARRPRRSSRRRSPPCHSSKPTTRPSPAM